LYQSLSGLAVGHVQKLELGAHCFGRLGPGVAIDIGDHDSSDGVAQYAGNTSTDAAGAAGDDGYLLFQGKHCRLLTERICERDAALSGLPPSSLQRVAE